MNSHMLSFDHGEINIRKVFWIMVVFETIALLIILMSNIYGIAYFAAIVLTPILLILIPVEPVKYIIA